MVLTTVQLNNNTNSSSFTADLVNPIKTADQGNNLIKTADLDTFLTIRCRNITKKLFIAELFSKRRHQVSQLSRGNEAVAVLVEVPAENLESSLRNPINLMVFLSDSVTRMKNLII